MVDEAIERWSLESRSLVIDPHEGFGLRYVGRRKHESLALIRVLSLIARMYASKGHKAERKKQCVFPQHTNFGSPFACILYSWVFAQVKFCSQFSRVVRDLHALVVFRVIIVSIAFIFSCCT